MSKSTMVELVEELEKMQPCKYLKEIIEDAKNGEFHDFKNEKYACGKMACSSSIRGLAAIRLDIRDDLLKIASDIENGEYDEQSDKVDKKRMRNEILQDEFMNDSQKTKLINLLGINK